MKRAILALIFGAAISVVAILWHAHSLVFPGPAMDWTYWSSSSSEPSPFQTAMLMSEEGWTDDSSSMPRAVVFSDLYPGELWSVVVEVSGGGFTSTCRTTGCYLYARSNGQPWETLHALPIDDRRPSLQLSRPWSFHALVEEGRPIELEVPSRGMGRGIYTLDISDYDPMAHANAPAMESFDGSANESEAENADAESDGEPAALPFPVRPPRCRAE